jgi:hypothetical protein
MISFRRWCIKKFLNEVKDFWFLCIIILGLLVNFIICGITFPDFCGIDTFSAKGAVGTLLTLTTLFILFLIERHVVIPIHEYRDILYREYTFSCNTKDKEEEKDEKNC